MSNPESWQYSNIVKEDENIYGNRLEWIPLLCIYYIANAP